MRPTTQTHEEVQAQILIPIEIIVLQRIEEIITLEAQIREVLIVEALIDHLLLEVHHRQRALHRVLDHLQGQHPHL